MLTPHIVTYTIQYASRHWAGRTRGGRPLAARTIVALSRCQEGGEHRHEPRGTTGSDVIGIPEEQRHRVEQPSEQHGELVQTHDRHMVSTDPVTATADDSDFESAL